MKELKLEHLCGYLPYDLASYKVFEGIVSIRPVTLHNIMLFIYGDINSKILLNPIKEIFNITEIMDLFSDDTLEAFKNRLIGFDDVTEYISGKQLLLCYKNHIDVYNLIGQGLALNKKDLKHII